MSNIEDFFDDAKPSNAPLKIAFIYIPLFCSIFIISSDLSAIVIMIGIGDILSSMSLRLIQQRTLPCVIQCFIHLFGASIPVLIFRFVLYRKYIQKRVIALAMTFIPFWFIGLTSSILVLSAMRITADKLFALPLPAEIVMAYYILRYGVILREPNGTPNIHPTWWEL